MKRCFKCGVEKPISEFYRHPMMADGHLGKCKACACKDVSENIRLKKLDPNWIAKERDRCRKKTKRARSLGLCQESPEKRKQRVLDWEVKYPHKRKAQYAAGNAYRDGRLVKPKSCHHCGKSRVRLQKHHPDYNFPLVVEWVCCPCHGIAHRKPIFAL